MKNLYKSTKKFEYYAKPKNIPIPRITVLFINTEYYIVKCPGHKDNIENMSISKINIAYSIFTSKQATKQWKENRPNYIIKLINHIPKKIYEPL